MMNLGRDQVSVTGDPFRGEESSVDTTTVTLPMPQAASLGEHPMGFD